MKKTTLLKASAILSSAIMTISAFGMTVMGAQSDKVSISLHDQKVYAGATVEIPMTMKTNNQCTAYDLLVEYDSNLELVGTNGTKASESFEKDNRKYVTLVGFEPSPYKDDSTVATIKLYVPPTVECDDYNVSFNLIASLSSDDGEFEDYTAEDAIVSVVPFESRTKGTKGRIAEKYSECKVFQKFDKNGKLMDAAVGYRGDANSDGKADINDAASIAKAIASKTINRLDERNVFFGDVNEDGKLSIKDARMIATFIAIGKTSWDNILR